MAASKLIEAMVAFADWKAIRNHSVAQRYLISLLSHYKEG
jgi:predicted HD phosphohydrolase